MRRLLAIALVSAALLFVPALPSFAAETLTEYLERAASAEYHAQQIVSCSTPDGSRDAVVEILQADGVLVAAPAVRDDDTLETGGGSMRMGDESVVTGDIDGAVDLDDHYTIDFTRSVAVAGRPAEQVTLRAEEGVVRAVLSFDEASGVLVQSTLLNADGSVWCDMRLVDLEQVSSDVTDGEATTTADLDPVDAPDDPRLPAVAGGIDRVDVYRWEEKGTVAYYSDGLLSFTVLASPRSLQLTAPDAVTVEVDGGRLTRWYGPGSVALSWESEEGGIAVFGDVPLDIQDRIVEDLPDPHDPGVFGRLWRNLFD